MSLANLIKKGGLLELATATVATPATAVETGDLSVAGVATVAVAKSPDSAANDSAPDPDRWCWPHSSAMNTAEIDLMIVRLDYFARRGMAEATRDKVVDDLMQRDREGDDRRLCVECRHCQPGPRCSQRMPVLDVLQRCDHFKIYPHLEGPSV